MHFLSPDTAVFGRRRDREPELYAHPQVAAAVIGSAVVGGAINSSASKSAANTQANAADRATAAQQGMFDKTVDLNSPFRQAGVDATSRLNTLLGIGNPSGAASADPSSINVPTTFQAGQSNDPLWEQILGKYNDASIARFGTPMNRSWDADPDAQRQYQALKQNYLDAKAAQQPQAPAAAPSPDFGSLAKPFSLSDFHLDPGIQFQTQQGNLALTNSMAAKDGVLSGGALKALIGYNQDMAGTGYQSAFDRYMAGKNFTLGSLMDVSKMGQAAASGVTSAAPSFSSGISSTIQGAGNASAAGTVGSANAISGGIQGAGNGIFLNSLLKNGGGGAATTPDVGMSIPAEFNQA